MRRAVLLASLVVCVSCQSSLQARGAKRYLKKETTADMAALKSVFIGWVDLGPDDWALHGYSDKREWEAVVIGLNRALQKLCQTTYLPGRTVVGAKDIGDTGDSTHDLHVKFSDVRINYNDYHLFTSIQFVDPRTNAVLGSIPVRPYYGNDWGFVNYLRAAMEEVAVKLQVEIIGGLVKKRR